MMAAAASYAVAALAFGLLAAQVLLRWRGRQHAMALGLAAVLTTVWAAITALLCWFDVDAPWLADLAELARSLGWLLLLLQILLRSGLRLRRLFLFAGAIAAVQLVAAAMTLNHASPIRGWLALASMAVLACRVLLAVQGMLVVEQLYRRTAHGQRWGIKFACLGLGTMFAYDFYLYSDALLFQRVDADVWAARGFVDAIVDVLTAKCVTALKHTGLKRLVIAGGVGANKQLRAALDAAAVQKRFQVFYPELEFCTDNGAMIAFAGALRLQINPAAAKREYGFNVRPRWPLDEIKDI